MKVHFFAVPALEPGQAAEDLARFLGAHRVATVDKALVQAGTQSFWAVCVTTVSDGPLVRPGTGAPAEKAPQVDYKEVLRPEQFALFVRLRELRKERALVEGVPPYALFTNAQLAQMVTDGVRTRQALQAIPGVGPARVEKHGEAFLAVLAGHTPVEGPDAAP